jgi:hypothetical protein
MHEKYKEAKIIAQCPDHLQACITMISEVEKGRPTDLRPPYYTMALVDVSRKDLKEAAVEEAVGGDAKLHEHAAERVLHPVWEQLLPLLPPLRPRSAVAGGPGVTLAPPELELVLAAVRHRHPIHMGQLDNYSGEWHGDSLGERRKTCAPREVELAVEDVQLAHARHGEERVDLLLYP